MNKKITRFAFGAKCGGLTVSGFAAPAASALASQSSASRPARPSMPKPLAKRRSIWRREREEFMEFADSRAGRRFYGQAAANLFGEMLLDFGMARNRFLASGLWVHPDRMPAALAKECTSVTLEM